MKRHVDALVRRALSDAIQAGELHARELPAFAVEVPADPKWGDLSTNAALVLARGEGRPPRAIAEAFDALYADRHAARRMGQAARERVNALGISWDSVIARLLS